MRLSKLATASERAATYGASTVGFIGLCLSASSFATLVTCRQCLFVANLAGISLTPFWRQLGSAYASRTYGPSGAKVGPTIADDLTLLVHAKPKEAARLPGGVDIRRGGLECSGQPLCPHCLRARYTPTRITAPPTIFSTPSTSPKKTIPEVTPVMVMRYW